MRRLLAVTLPTAVLWAMTSIAVDRFADRELFVPPPDAMAEEFIRAVTTRRYEQARSHLTRPEAMTTDEVRALASRLGNPDTIEAETLSRDAARALVTVRISSAEKSDAMSLSLVFEEGGWAVEPP